MKKGCAMRLTENKVFSAIFKEIHRVEKINYRLDMRDVPVSDIIKMHLWSIMYELKLQDNPEDDKRLKMFLNSN